MIHPGFDLPPTSSNTTHRGGRQRQLSGRETLEGQLQHLLQNRPEETSRIAQIRAQIAGLCGKTPEEDS